MYFRFLVIISTWKRSGPFILTKLNLLHQKMVFAKFGWNWLSGSGEDCYICQFILLFRNYLPSVVQWFGRRCFFFKFINVFSLFGNYLLLEKNRALYMNKLKSSLPKYALCQVFFEIGRMVLERRFFYFHECFFAIS